jgi:hypothetical protein
MRGRERPELAQAKAASRGAGQVYKKTGILGNIFMLYTACSAGDKTAVPRRM